MSDANKTGRRIFALAPAILAIALMLTAALAPAPAQAQAQPPAATVSTADLEGLLSAVEDPAERRQLISRIKALIAAQKQSVAKAPPASIGARFIRLLTDRVKETSEQLAGAADLLSEAPKLVQWLRRQVEDSQARNLWLRIVLKLIIVVAVGYAVGLAVRVLLAKPRRLIEARENDNILIRLLFLAARTLVDLVPIAVFAAVAFAILPLTEPGAQTRVVVLAVVNAAIVIAAVMAVGRAFLVPAVAGLRVLPITDVNSNYLFLWLRRFVYAAATGYFLIEAALLLGLPAGGQRLLLNILGLFITIMAIIFIMQNRQAVAAAIRGPGKDEGGGEDRHGLRNLRDRFADIWHALATVYVVAIYATSALRIEGGFEFVLRATVLTVVIFAIARLLVFALRRAVNRGFALRDEVKDKFPSLEARANRYLPVLHTVLRVAVYVIAALAVLGAWGVDSFSWLETPVGRRLVQGGVTIAFVLIIALAFWEAVSAAIERYLAKTDEDGDLVERGARARTLLPLLRNAVFVALLVMVTLIVLAELGVNIGPLLAGAGVIGLALGIGSQKLVQDIITGVFILFEDSISVGDVVTLGGHNGTVEALSIRSIRLRDPSGGVHTIPFSAVDTVTNLTKDYGVYTFEIGVAYRENVDEVMDAMRDLADEMEADSEFGPEIVQPLSILGVNELADSAVVIKARYWTRPGNQWMVGREFNRRIKNRFDELGIEIPFPHTTVYFGEDKAGGAPAIRYRPAEDKPPREPRQPTPARRSITSRGSGGGAGEDGD